LLRYDCLFITLKYLGNDCIRPSGNGSCTILVFYSQLDGIKAVSNKPKASSQALVIED